MVDAGASSAIGSITKINKASSHSTLVAKLADDEYLIKGAWKNGLQLRLLTNLWNAQLAQVIQLLLVQTHFTIHINITIFCF
jgi:hypothetical protein